jgi:single-stranded DNA-binding protein
MAVVITVTGFISEQPEIRYSSEPVIRFSVVDKQRRKKTGTDEWEWVYVPFNFELWGKDATYHAERMYKGREVVAVGVNPKISKWTDDGGNKHERMTFELASVSYPYNERASQSAKGNNEAPQSRSDQAPKGNAQQPREQAAPRFARKANQSAEPAPRQQQSADVPAKAVVPTGTGTSRFNRNVKREDY